MTTTAAIVARGLTKAFGDVHALDGLDLTVPEATVVALLGPNGAGKTTAISILTTLLSPDAGTAASGARIARDFSRRGVLVGRSHS